MKKNMEVLEPRKEDKETCDSIARCNRIIEKMTGLKIDKALPFLEDVERTAESRFMDERHRIGFVKAALPSSVDYRVLKFWLLARKGFFGRLAND